MKSIAIIKAHPSSDDVVLVQLPPAIAPAIKSDIPHLWWDPRRTAWRMRADAVDELHTVCTRLDVAVIDEREPDAPVWTGPLRHRPLPQCRWCATPARRADSAKLLHHCPTCGRAWDPIEVSPDELTSRATRDCPVCGHTQAAGWAYCSRCGQPIPALAPVPVRAPPTPPREQLQDPMPLREALDQLPLLYPLRSPDPQTGTHP